ncbi:hypothetical protein BASA84_000367 [Batrachochytrium salamandrivorans]|nr:hypothetical protein BASA84_000367 [Batrachochytrium salamandrivorans]
MGTPDYTPSIYAVATTPTANKHAPHGLNVIVEGSADICLQDNEIFVTQRGGKIIQGPISGNEIKSATVIETRRTLQSTLLLQKKREMQTVQTLLEKKRAEFEKRMEECCEKQEELQSKQKQIRDRVAKFEKFLKENDAKRQRANAKSITERKLREAKELELCALQRQLHTEQLKNHGAIKLINRHKVYERYLQSIIDVLPPDYLDVNEPHINDIIMRHNTLVKTNDELKSIVQINQDDIGRLQGTLTGLIKDKNDLILVYNSKLGTQQKYLDKLRQDCAYLEQRLEERDSTSKERMRILSEIKLAIDNLYDRIAIHSQTTKIVQSDLTPASENDSRMVQVAPGLIATSAIAGVATLSTTTPTITTTVSGASVGVGAAAAAAAAATTASVMSLVAFKDKKSLTEKLHALQYRILDLQGNLQCLKKEA